jgi:putative hydrolase of the HAD superfamily
MKMALTPVQAVVFDMGGTLEELYYDDASRLEATRGLKELLCRLGLDPGLSVPELKATVLKGMGAYQAWREETEIELPPERVWTEYVLPNHGVHRERLAAAAEELAFFHDTHFHVRSLRPEAPSMVEELNRKGFRLAIISNIVSRRMVPCKLAEYGLAGYFDPVLTSSEFGQRKPNAQIFLEAARLMQLPPAGCAYVGDTISRDVIGARRAGYGLAIQIRSFLTDKVDHGAGIDPEGSRTMVPDAVIYDLMQVIPIVCPGGENQGGD